METYSYKAVAKDGKDKKGTLEAESREEAIRKLKESGVIPTMVEAQNLLQKDIELPFLKKKKVSDRDLSVLCRQFASILKAGVSIVNSLEMLADQTENKNLQKALTAVQSSVEKGETLAGSMRNSAERLFPSIMVSMVEAGEASGNMERTFEQMAVQFEKNAKLKGQVKKAMMYPVILCIVAIAVVAVMMMFVIPNFMEMFEELDTGLPLATVIVINISNAFTNYWYVILLALIGLVAAFKLYVRTDGGRHVVDALKLKIPVFGKLAQKTACAQFSRTLATLLQSGMPMLRAIEITADTMTNVLFKDALLKAKNGVGLGMLLSRQLEQSKLFPAMVIHMIGIGEEAGSIEEMLGNIASYYDEEVEITTQQATALMEPMIIVVMAVLVGGIIMAIYGPMIELYNTLG